MPPLASILAKHQGPRSTLPPRPTVVPAQMDLAELFYPTSAVQLHGHYHTPCQSEPHIPKALTWHQFWSQRKFWLYPVWKIGVHPSATDTIALWPQHLAIKTYFTQTPNGTASSFSCFTGLIQWYTTPDNLGAWKAALGMRGSTCFVDTILCPPLCPLQCHTHGCGHDVAMSTQPNTPSFFSLAHWAWPFLTLSNWAHLCHIPMDDTSRTTMPGNKSKNVGMSLGHTFSYAGKPANGPSAT